MSKHAILDLGEDDLQFTENNYSSSSQQNTESLTEFPEASDLDTDRLIDDGGENERTYTSNFWTLAFYQQFFDVDTVDVKNRVIYSMVPIPGKSFLQHYIRPKPDLYGPIWICLTLVFSIAITGNLSDYLASATQESGPHWHYDFHKVTLAATAVFSYATLLPAGLAGFLWWMGSGAGTASLTFLELLSLYGYSLAIYVPVSILWLIQVNWVQWLLVLAGAGLSGAVLFMTVWPAIRDQAAKSAAIVMCVLLALHLLLACGFMLYFFHHDSVATPVQPTQAPGVHNVTLAAAMEAEAQRIVETTAASSVPAQKKNVIVSNEAEDGKDKDNGVANVQDNKDNGVANVQDNVKNSKIVEDPTKNGETNRGANSASEDKMESEVKPNSSGDNKKPS